MTSLLVLLVLWNLALTVVLWREITRPAPDLKAVLRAHIRDMLRDVAVGASVQATPGVGAERIRAYLLQRQQRASERKAPQ